jgi:hypothetical protein
MPCQGVVVCRPGAGRSLETATFLTKGHGKRSSVEETFRAQKDMRLGLGFFLRRMRGPVRSSALMLVGARASYYMGRLVAARRIHAVS